MLNEMREHVVCSNEMRECEASLNEMREHAVCSISEFYISKKQNFIKFLSEICDDHGSFEHAPLREAKLAEAANLGYEDMVKQGIFLRGLLATGNIKSYVRSMFDSYGVSIDDLPTEVLKRVYRYIDLFSEI